MRTWAGSGLCCWCTLLGDGQPCRSATLFYGLSQGRKAHLATVQLREVGRREPHACNGAVAPPSPFV